MMNHVVFSSAPAESSTILFICDEGEGMTIWVDILRLYGFQVTVEHQPMNILEVWSQVKTELVVWDIKAMNSEQVRIIRNFRAKIPAPLILLLPYYHEENILAYYQAGADECIVNPVSPAVLGVKLKGWIRRMARVPVDVLPTVQNNRMSLDAESRALNIDGSRSIPLTTMEYRLLYLLMSQPGKVIKSSRLVQNLWGSNGEGDRILLKNLVYRLRQKIEDDPAHPQIIRTMPGHGYSFHDR